MQFKITCCILSLLGCLDLTPAAADWPQFRGPNSDGVLALPAGTSPTIPREWSETSNLAWKVPLPGPGWSQPVVVGDNVYVTAAVSQKLAPPKGFSSGSGDFSSFLGGLKKAPDITIDWQVLCFDLATGEKRWQKTAVAAKPQHAIHPSNTYATETPVADQHGVYAYFAPSGKVVAFDPAGKLRWERDLGAYKTMQNLGPGSSPAICDGKMIINCFNEEKAFTVCLNTADGTPLWQVDRKETGTSWSTPLVWQTSAGRELVISGQKLMTGLDPATGKELWRIAGFEMPGASSPTCDAERIYWGYVSPFARTPLYAVPAGLRGDLSPAKGSKDIQDQAWSVKNGAPDMPTPLSVGGKLYILNDNIVRCFNAATGKELYKQRLQQLQNVAASPVAVGNLVLIVDEAGNAELLSQSEKYERVGGGKLADMFWSTPAVTPDAILFRGQEHLFCVRAK
ncbi:MAG: PQQ-binding-like beta-propeller repeat protein [Pirellulales bacterium]|nr:PQQ-binding-like beta-propeller repeat protein [Pirellulales bacterium]